MLDSSAWVDRFALDVNFGLLGGHAHAPKRYNPRVVLNSKSSSMLRALREELTHSTTFIFSVAFVSPRAIALLKQELIDFIGSGGSGHIVTSDYLGFNTPGVFEELLSLR